MVLLIFPPTPVSSRYRVKLVRYVQVMKKNEWCPYQEKASVQLCGPEQSFLEMHSLYLAGKGQGHPFLSDLDIRIGESLGSGIRGVGVVAVSISGVRACPNHHHSPAAIRYASNKDHLKESGLDRIEIELPPLLMCVCFVPNRGARSAPR